jgi:hypothetical protein
VVWLGLVGFGWVWLGLGLGLLRVYGLCSHTLHTLHATYSYNNSTYVLFELLQMASPWELLPPEVGWGSNGAVEVGQGSVGGAPKDMQGMARCPRSKCDPFECAR